MRTRNMTGHPSASLIELSRETPHDLIALATHGRSGMTRWVLGSVAEALVRGTGDPVLIIPSESAANATRGPGVYG